jgi:hypothetical protein
VDLRLCQAISQQIISILQICSKGQLRCSQILKVVITAIISHNQILDQTPIGLLGSTLEAIITKNEEKVSKPEAKATIEPINHCVTSKSQLTST